MNVVNLKNVQLDKYNTLGIKAVASIMCLPINEDGILEVYSKYVSKKIIVIGKGSNILFTREYYDDEFVFLNLNLMNEIKFEKDTIYSEAGAKLSELSWYAISKNIDGFEFLEDIPGSVGGALIMNAGTYNSSIGDLVKSIRYFDIDRKEIIDLEPRNEDFRYRNSLFDKMNVLIIGATFNTSQGSYIKSLDLLLEIKKRRYLKQPRNYLNAGSVFKRPFVNGQEYFAWKLINDAGLRGICSNGAEISEKHTGFIVNKGEAKYSDIQYLIDLCQQEVYKKFSIELELEWKKI